MSWKLPQNRIQSNDPTTPESVNENFFEVVHESGKFNEHNFQSNAISSSSSLTTTAAYLITHSYQAVNPGIVDASSGTNNTTGGADNDIIGHTTSWVGIEDLSVTIKTEDSILWILGSVQVMNSTSVALGVSIDGYVLPETILGGVTEDNDPNGFGMEKAGPFVVDAIIPVEAGEHTVEIVVKFKDFAPDLASSATVQNRELIVLELRR